MVGLSYHNRVSTTHYRFYITLPHTASTSGTDCVGVTIIAYLRHAARSAHGLRHCCARREGVALLRSRLVGCCTRWGGGRMAGRGGIVTEWAFHFLFDAFFSRKTKKFATRFA